MRACSGEVNRTAGFYHAGLSADLAAVLEHAMQVRAIRVYRSGRF